MRRTAHPKKPKQALNGGPQMVELSRDGKRSISPTRCTRLGMSSSILMG